MLKSAQVLSAKSDRVRRPLLGVAAILASVLLLSACGGQSGTGTEPQNPGSESTSPGSLSDMLPSRYKDAGAIKFGTTPNNPPWSLHDDAANKFSGFEPALIGEMSKRLGVSADISGVQYEGLQIGLLAGKFDIMISSMHDTAVREKQMVFLDYANVGSAFLTAKGNPRGIVDLASACGEKLIVNPSSVQLSIIESYQPECKKQGKDPIDYVTLPDQSASLLGVQGGKGAAFFGDKVALTYLAANASGDPVEVNSSTDAGVEPGFVGMAAQIDNKDLIEALQASLQSMIDDGTYASILSKYDFTFVGVDQAHINGTTTAKTAG